MAGYDERLLQVDTAQANRAEGRLEIEDHARLKHVARSVTDARPLVQLQAQTMPPKPTIAGQAVSLHYPPKGVHQRRRRLAWPRRSAHGRQARNFGLQDRSLASGWFADEERSAGIGPVPLEGAAGVE